MAKKIIIVFFTEKYFFRRGEKNQLGALFAAAVCSVKLKTSILKNSQGAAIQFGVFQKGHFF